MSIITLRATRFTLDAQVDQPADLGTIDVGAANAFQQADPGATLTLRAGYVQDGTPETLDLIVGGVVDWYVVTTNINRSAVRLTGQLKTRDAMATLLDTEYRLIYRNGPTPQVTDGSLQVPEANGLFTARQIAEHIADAAGLGLHWECPDYAMLDSFQAVGRPFDLIRNLVRPFSLLDAIKTDVFTLGSTLYVRQRDPLRWVASALNTFSLASGKISSVQVRKFRTDKIGLVSLQGARQPGGVPGGTTTPTAKVPVLTWSDPAPITWPTALSSSQLDARADVAGTFEYSPPDGTSPEPGTQTLSANFIPDDPAYKSGTVKATLIVNKIAVTLAWSAPASIQWGTALSATQLNATASEDGSFSYTPSEGTVLKAGTYTLTAKFSAADSAHYDSGLSISVTLSVLPKTVPTITWADPADIDSSTPLGPTQLNATASEAGTFEYNPDTGTTLSPGVHALHVKFTPDADTSVAVHKTVSITVTGTPPGTVPSILWDDPADITEGTLLSGTQLNATAEDPVTHDPVDGTFDYRPDSGTELAAGAHTLAVTFSPTDSGTYQEATASVSLTVLPKTEPVIDWATPTDLVFGQALSATQLNATVEGDLDGALDYSPGSGTVLNPGSHTLRVTFTPTEPIYTQAHATVTLLVVRPLISWPPPADAVVGDTLGVDRLNATANVDGTFEYNPPAGTVLTEVGSINLTATFTPTAEGAAQIQRSRPLKVLDSAASDPGAGVGTYIIADTATGPGGYVTTQTTYRTPGDLMLEENSQTYLSIPASEDGSFGGISGLSKLHNRVLTWEASIPGANGALANQPRQLGEFLHEASISVDTKNKKSTITEVKTSTTYSYDTPYHVVNSQGGVLGTGVDPRGLLNTKIDSSWKREKQVDEVRMLGGFPSLTEPFVPDKMSVERYRDRGANGYAVATESYTWNQPSGEAGFWQFDPSQSNVSPSPGTRAGGINSQGGAVPALGANDSRFVPQIQWNPNPSSLTWPDPLTADQLNAIADVDGAFVYSPGLGAILVPGTQKIVCVFTPSDPQYKAVTATASISVAKATPTITWATPEPVFVGSALSGTQLNATADYPGAPVYRPQSGTVMTTAGTHTLKVTWLPDDTTDVATATATVDLEVIALRIPDVTWPDPADITEGTALSGTQLNAVFTDPVTLDPVDGTPVYKPDIGDDTLKAGFHTLRVTFTPTDASQYATAHGKAQLTVTGTPPPTTPTITWEPEGPITYGDALGAGQLNAVATDPGTFEEVPGTFVYAPAAGEILLTGTHTLELTFTPTDTDTYQEVSATAGLQISAMAASVTWDAPADVAEGVPLSATQLNATADVAGAFAYSPGAGVTLPAGTHTLRLTFTPSNPYIAPVSDSVTLRVVRPHITWSKPSDVGVGTALDETQLSATADFAGTFTYNPPAGTIMGSIGVVTLNATFAPSGGGNLVLKSVDLRVTQDAVSGGAGNASGPYITRQFRVDPDPTAPPVDLSDANLDAGTLDLIGRQVAGASGLWQWELTLAGVNVPWLRRGDIFRLTGLRDETGAEIILPPCIVQGITTVYDAPGEHTYTKSVKGLGWTTDPVLTD